MLKALRSSLRRRTPSPQRGEGWGEGTPTERPYPLTPPSPLWGEGEDASCHSIIVLPEGREDRPGHDETVETE
jgi:hypothetical protein